MSASRPTKRASPAAEIPDTTRFVDEYCRSRGLVPEAAVGTSLIEKQCIRSAEEARQSYKSHRDHHLERHADIPHHHHHNHAFHPGVPAPPSTTATSSAAAAAALSAALSPAQKYSRRLFNNRKSAAAAKVYQDVLRRELATALQRPVTPAARERDPPIPAPSRAELDHLRADNARLHRSLAESDRERLRIDAELKRVKMRVVSLKSIHNAVNFWERVHHRYAQKDYMKMEDEPAHHPLASPSQEMDILQLGSQTPLPASLPASLPTSLPASQQFLQVPSRPASQPGPQVAAGIQANAIRSASDMALSPMAVVGAPGEFQTGFTCSQSQKEEDSDDVLARTSHQLSSALPIPIPIGSQSQELPSMKTPLGSDENPLGDDNIYLDSQGSKGS